MNNSQGCKVVTMRRVLRYTYTAFRSPKKRSQRLTSKALHQLLLSRWAAGTIDQQEVAKILLLNSRRHLVGMIDLTKRTLADFPSSPDFPELPYLEDVSSMIVAYNSPTGSLWPDATDMELAEKFLLFTCKSDIELQDQLIISSKKYFSFRDKIFRWARP